MLVCKRCGYKWNQKLESPKRCPNCISPYWDKPRNKITEVEFNIPKMMQALMPLHSLGKTKGFFKISGKSLVGVFYED